MLLRKPGSVNVQAIIAIHGQREFPVETNSVSHSLILRVDDTEAPSTTDLLQASRVRWRQRQAAEVGLTLVPPTIDDARSIIDFAQSIRQMDGVLLCQCQGGVSRSAAAALLCLGAWTGPGHEKYCVERLLHVRPCASPHPDLVAFGDSLLGRKGQLLQAANRAQS